MHSSYDKLSRQVGLVALIVAIAAGVFVFDVLVPRGSTPWVLYVIPVILAFFSRHTLVPFAVAGLASVFLWLGLNLDASAGFVTPSWAIFNRSIGMVTVWLLAIVGSRLVRARLETERREWGKSGLTELDALLRGGPTPEELSKHLMAFLPSYVGAEVGALYLITDRADGGQQLALTGGYALPEQARERLALDEGWVGQAFHDRRGTVLRNLPADYLPVTSSMGRTPSTTVTLTPLCGGDSANGVLELGFRGEPTEAVLSFLQEAARALHVAIHVARYQDQLERLLRRTQEQAEELQTQQEELRVGNEELEERNRSLREAQTRLEQQQAELEQTNEQLEEQTAALEEQRNLLQLRNGEIEQAREALKEHANRLEAASRYKSEFLANMSHELRTPLNSSLILAKLLAENREGNLTEEQIGYANTIYDAGNDLLTLINDILDLSKVASGKLRVTPGTIEVSDLMKSLRTNFEPLAREKGLGFEVAASPRAPESFVSDRQRVEQILKNFLSNAFKFTEKGAVRVEISPAADGQIAFSVTDTGIGIPADKQDAVFEAFRQADGTTSRKYGGTGLGLSISRDLSKLLGGEVLLKSTPGEGSTFTLVLPEKFEGPRKDEPVSGPSRLAVAGMRSSGDAALESEVSPAERRGDPVPASRRSSRAGSPRSWADDRDASREGRRTLLVIEDDRSFARILFDLAHELGFRCLVAEDSEEGIRLATAERPDGILLDIKLPDVSGLTVLDRLKTDSRTRHIPVHVISAMDYTQTAMQLGAIGYMIKPVRRESLREIVGKLEEKLTRRVKRVLVVEDDRVQRQSICALLSDDEVSAEGVATAREALELLRKESFDTMVIDLTLPDLSGFEVLERLSRDEAYSHPPVIVYTARSLSSEEEDRLRRYSESIIIKGARSPERLLDEVTLFLHRVESELSPDRQKLIQKVRRRDRQLEGRKILIADDDARNIFALTAALEGKGAKVVAARDGRDALGRLESDPEIELVIMDIMMPVMDGYEATRMIRKNPKYVNLPVIAVTAKAMRDDQDRSLEAGANDYLAKPVDVDKLTSLVRVWMPARSDV